jgi:hypothetical protein
MSLNEFGFLVSSCLGRGKDPSFFLFLGCFDGALNVEFYDLVNGAIRKGVRHKNTLIMTRFLLYRLLARGSVWEALHSGRDLVVKGVVKV